MPENWLHDLFLAQQGNSGAASDATRVAPRQRLPKLPDNVVRAEPSLLNRSIDGMPQPFRTAAQAARFVTEGSIESGKNVRKNAERGNYGRAAFETALNIWPEGGFKAFPLIGAMARRGSKLLKFEHYSKTPNLSVLDPAFAGTGRPGTELMRSDRLPTTHVYLSKGRRLEPQFAGDYRYTGEIEESKIYDIARDKDGILERARQANADGPLQGSLDTTEMERILKDAGFEGFYSSYSSQPSTVKLFNKIRVREAAPVKHEGRRFGVAHPTRDPIDALAQRMYDDLHSGNGFSYNAKGETVKEGFAVGAGNEPGNALLSMDLADVTPEKIAAHLRKHPMSNQSLAGGWVDGGKIYIEPSTHVATGSEAMRLGRQRGEKAYGDLAAYARKDFENGSIPITEGVVGHISRNPPEELAAAGQNSTPTPVTPMQRETFTPPTPSEITRNQKWWDAMKNPDPLTPSRVIPFPDMRQRINRQRAAQQKEVLALTEESKAARARFDETAAEIRAEPAVRRSELADAWRNVLWHGTPSGDLRGAKNGLHIGTRAAAREALEARIGRRADGLEWDGTKVYGETPLVGHGLKPAALPSGKAGYSDGSKVSLNSKPTIIPVRIKTPSSTMVNGKYNAADDDYANGRMRAQITKGNAKRGYYYKNKAEDEGSISAVLPNAGLLDVLGLLPGKPRPPAIPPQSRVPRLVRPKIAQDRVDEVEDLAHKAYLSPSFLKMLNVGNKLKGGPDWYDTRAISEKAKDALGDDDGMEAFNRLMDFMGATTARSKPDNNLRRASWWRGLELAGMLDPANARAITLQAPKGMGHIGQKAHAHGVAKMIERGEIDPLGNPKPRGFVENLKMNWMPFTNDTRMATLATNAEPKLLKSSGLREQFASKYEKGKVTTLPSGSWAYDPMERAAQRAAEELRGRGLLEVPDGLAPTAPMQASVWVGAKPEEHAGSFADTFDTLLGRTAKLWGKKPSEANRLLWEGNPFDLPLNAAMLRKPKKK